MPIPPPESRAPLDIDYIRQTLAARPFFSRFPPALEARFLAKRIDDSVYYITTGQWPLLLMFLLITWVSVGFFQEILAADNFLQLKFVEIPLGLSILFIILGPGIPSVRAYFHRVMFPVAVFQVSVLVIHIFLTAPTGYYLYAVMNLVFSILLIALGLRFRSRSLAVLLVAAAAIGVGLARFMRLEFDGLAFAYYYGLFSTIVFALAVIAERQERFALLQELLSAHQSRELERLNERLDRIAHEDALTGIANRRSFDAFAARAWDIARRDGTPLTLLLMDVDYFKKYNDTYGHEQGDRCLQEVAAAIREAVLRPADLAARYGGEEFAVLMPGTDEAGAIEVAERILRGVDSRAIPHAASTVAPHVTVSLGIATVRPSAGSGMTELIRFADEALYEAKGAGRHGFRVYGGGVPG